MTYVSANEKAVSLNLHRYKEVFAKLPARDAVKLGADSPRFSFTEEQRRGLWRGPRRKFANPADPWLESARFRFQPLNLKYDMLVSSLCFSQMQLAPLHGGSSASRSSTPTSRAAPRR